MCDELVGVVLAGGAVMYEPGDLIDEAAWAKTVLDK